MVDKTTDNKLLIVSLYKSDYLAQFHVREIAKLTKKSHVTLLPHLKFLEKDKILSSKIIGKNKIYSLNLDNIIAKDYIALSEVAESISFLEQVFLIKKIYSKIFELNLNVTIILFGSYAKRTFKQESDIDVFCLGDIKQYELDQIKKLGQIYGKTINIKRSSLKNFEEGLRKKDALIMEIIKKHILIHNQEPFINALWKYYNEIK